MGEEIKVYVAVNADFDEYGRLIPHVVTWEDGKKYRGVEGDKLYHKLQGGGELPLNWYPVTEENVKAYIK